MMDATIVSMLRGETTDKLRQTRAWTFSRTNPLSGRSPSRDDRRLSLNLRLPKIRCKVKIQIVLRPPITLSKIVGYIYWDFAINLSSTFIFPVLARVTSDL